MATTAVQNPPSESKSAKKKKAKAEAAANGAGNATAVPDLNGQAESSHEAKEDGDGEHPFIKELAKHIRNVHKKLGGLQKVDAVIAENPGVSLDDLVASRKINADQKAAVQKKPQLQQQLAGYEEQIAQYRKFDADFQAQLAKQKEELTSKHQKEVEALKEELSSQGKTSGVLDLRSNLFTFTKFLRLAAAKRMMPEEKDTEEAYAFEGALLVVYGGDENAVETAVNIIEGAEEFVPNTEGVATTVKYSQIKKASVEHAPYEDEERWVDSVAEANTQSAETDPTVAHAGLTELDATGQVNGMGEAPLGTVTSPPNAGAGDEQGNAAGDRWDTNAAGEDSKVSDESFEMVPRPADEVDTPAPSALPADALMEKSGNSWADEPTYDNPPAGFNADTGDVKGAIARGESQVDSSSGGATEPSQPLSAGGWAGSSDAAAGANQEDGDGFHQVPGRHRGRGGRGRGDGEFRGRGGRGRGGFRGDGEFRGRGRGAFRGRGEGGEFRGRGGRGRGGPRGGAEGVAPAASS